MRRGLLLLALPALALPSTAAAEPRPKSTKVILTECTTSLQQAERVAVFEGRMRASRPGQRLQMRFTLQSRPNEDARWTRVAVAGWDEWVTADPGTTRYVYEKRIDNLAAPMHYRATVRYRWRSVTGKSVRFVRLSSTACRQPDLRPDLSPLRIEVDPGPEQGTARYSIPVRNHGRSASGSFELVLSVDGVDQPGRSVDSLAAGERRAIEIVAPRCKLGAGGLSVRLDAPGAVDERDEADNIFTRSCPAANR